MKQIMPVKVISLFGEDHNLSSLFIDRSQSLSYFVVQEQGLKSGAVEMSSLTMVTSKGSKEKGLFPKLPLS